MDHNTRMEKNAALAMVENVDNHRKVNFDEDNIHWWRQPGLRRLYLLMPFLFLGSTTLGYDGSLLNGLQAMPSWTECEFNVELPVHLVNQDSLPQPHRLFTWIIRSHARLWRTGRAFVCSLHR